MAAYAITRLVSEDFDVNVVAAALETYLETLDSTNNPIIMCNIFQHPRTGKYVGVILAD